MDGLGPGFGGVGNDATVESSQLSAVRFCKRYEISVGDLTGGKKTRAIKIPRIENTDVVRPEEVAGQGAKFREQSSDSGSGRTARRVWIPGITDNSRHGIFGEWTSSPGFAVTGRKPNVDSVVMDVRRIKKRDQHVYVQQEGSHVSSSRN